MKKRLFYVKNSYFLHMIVKNSYWYTTNMKDDRMKNEEE